MIILRLRTHSICLNLIDKGAVCLALAHYQNLECIKSFFYGRASGTPI